MKWLAGVRVVQQERAAMMIRLLKTYRGEKDLGGRKALAEVIARTAGELAAFDEFRTTPTEPPR